MPQSDWERAYDESAREEAQRERAEKAQYNIESAGLMGAVGVLAAATLGPVAAKKAARTGISALGKRVAGSADDAYQRAKKTAASAAKEADETVTNLAGRSHMDEAISGLSGTAQRAKAAAVRQNKTDGRVDLSKFLDDVGFSAPKRLRGEAQEWRKFKSGRGQDAKKVQQQGWMKTFLESDDQRKLLSSAASHAKLEQAVQFPAAYAADRAVGITGAPEDRPAYDIPGHIQDTINYLPTYAAYEVAGATTIGAIGQVGKLAGTAAKKYLSGEGTAKAVSRSFSAIEKAGRFTQQATSPIQNRFNRARTASSQHMVQRGYEAGRGYMQGRGGESTSAVERFMERRTAEATRESSTLRGARRLFGDESSHEKLMDAASAATGEGKTRQLFKDMERALFASTDSAQPRSKLGRVFGGDPVTIGDLEKSSQKLGDRARQQLYGMKEKPGDLDEAGGIVGGFRQFKNRVQAESRNVTGSGVQEMMRGKTYKDLRVSGYAKLGGEVMRMPQAQDLASVGNRFAESLTQVRIPGTRQGFSLSNVLGGQVFGSRRAAVDTIEGAVPNQAEGKMMHFGEADELADLADDAQTQMFKRGFRVQSEEGLGNYRFYGQQNQGKISEIGTYRVRGKGGKLTKAAHRRFEKDELYRRSEKERVEGTSAEPQSFLGQQAKELKDTLRLGQGGGFLQRTKDLMGGGAPSRLFAEGSELYNKSFRTAARRKEMLPAADAIYNTRQALINSTETLTQEGIMDKRLLKNAGLPESKIDELGGAEAIIHEDETALEAAEHVLKEVSNNLGETHKALQAPTTPQAAKIIRKARVDPDSVHNRYGKKRADTLRRFIFEQGALGTAHGNRLINRAAKDLDDMAKKGRIDPDMAKEGQVGLLSLKMQHQAGQRFSDPYKQLSKQGVQWSQTEEFQSAMKVVRSNDDMLQKFAESRPRMDFAYHRDPYSAPQNFKQPYKKSDFFATGTSVGSTIKTMADSGFDTMRRALSEAGLGWSPKTSVTTKEGARELAQTWTSRAGAAVGAAFGMRLVDAGADVAIPDDLPGGEGVTTELAEIAANARLSASYVYDALGITDAAQYMEGLAPKSTSMLPGAAAGMYATNSILGAVAGATLNRAMQPLLTNTPFESLSILPPLAPFVSNMSEPYETTRAKYEGRQWIPQRSGRFFMLSSTNYEGEGIESYRPNWYVRQKSDYEATPVKYGSKFEEAVFKDLPLIDFAPGDLIDPQHIDKKHAQERPYAEPSAPFSEVPVVGPALGATVGKAYNWLHPLGTNKPIGMESTVGAYGPNGTPRPGLPSGGGRMAPGQAQASQDIQTAGSAGGVLDESFYRATEAMGFTGFLTQQAAGGESLTGRPTQPSGDRIDSTARSYHDLKMGDMLGLGEAARRLYPFERGNMAQGPRNQMPDWMNAEMRCITLDTEVEVNGSKIVKAQNVEKGDLVRTHNGNIDPVTKVQTRDMDEDESLYEISIGNLRPVDMKVSEEHPFWTKEGWKEIEDVEVGEFVGYPVPELKTLLNNQTAVDLVDYKSDNATVTDQWVYNYGSNSEVYQLVEYIEEEKDGNPYWEYGEAREVCEELGVEYRDGIGADARRRYNSLTDKEGRISRVPRYVDVDTEEFGTLAGYLLAEGSATESQVRMPITGDYGEEFASAFESVFGIRPNPQQRDYENITRWCVSNTVLARFFRDFFRFPGASKRLHLTENNWKDFLRTLMNGDGSFFKTGNGKWQCSLKQNHNQQMLYRVWQVALAHGIVGAISNEALVFRGEQAVEFARLIEFDKAEESGILEETEPEANKVDVSQYVDFTVTDEWIYNRESTLAPLVEYIEEEKDGDPYWNKGEAQDACEELGVEYYSGIGASARKAYNSLQKDSNWLYRIPRYIDVNDCEWLTSDYRTRKVLEQVVQGLREDELISEQYTGNYSQGGGFWHFEDGYWWSKLAEKKEIDQEQLISIEVKGDHSFCLPGVATHNSGDPYCLAEDALIEANEDLERAEDVYRWVKEGKEVAARTHKGNLKEIEAASKRPVDEEIVKIQTSLPWDLKVTEEHPVLVLDEEETQWRLAGNVEEGDQLLDPMGPGHPKMVTQCYRPLKGHPYQWTRPQNAETIDALRQIRDIQPPPKDRFHTIALDEDQVLRMDYGMALPGSPRSQRKKKAICRLCREMQERGFPPTIVGTPIGPLRPIIKDWGEMDMDVPELRIPITPQRIRPEHEEWGMWEAYEPKRSDKEATRSAAYRLLRAFTNATTIPTRIEEDGDTYTIVLDGRDAAWHLFSYYERSKSRKQVRKFKGTQPRKSTEHGKMAVREVQRVEKVPYEGPVYAFQVADDESFVAAGVATHNSKVAMGEALMPGEGLEATGKLTGGEAPIEASDIGRNSYDAAMNMLGIERSKPGESWAKEAVKKRMVDSNVAVRTDAVFVDEQSGLTAVADAATKGNQPIHVRSMTDAEFDAANKPRKLDTMKVNAMLGAADRTQGMIAHVNEETGEVKTHIQKFDSGLYNETLAQLQEGRQMAKKYAQQGYGKDGAMYSSVDRLQVLMNADPFGDKWQIEQKKAQKKYYSGNMTREEKNAYERIKRQHDKMRQPFEMHEKRFETDELLNPDETHVNRSYNQNVKAASEYSLPERIAGSVWQSATSMRSPLHTKFFGNYSPKEQYERRVLLQRDYQSWSDPVDDFVKPYTHGALAADDPMQGALSWGLGGATFGNPAMGAAGAIAGSVYGGARNVYESLGGDDYVPGEIQKQREQGRKLDRVKYYRAKRLHDATGAQKYLDQMQDTATGWTQQGMEGDGWAKDRRRSYAPANRSENPLFSGDEGFSSPYRGIQKIDDFADAIRKNTDEIISLGRQKLKDFSRIGPAIRQNAQRSAPNTKKVAAQSQRAGATRSQTGAKRMSGSTSASGQQAARRKAESQADEMTSSTARSERRANASDHAISPSDRIEGMNEMGMAAVYRSENAPLGSGLGFGSPYQGEDPEQAVNYKARDPDQQVIPPEMLTAFGAAPENEKDFLRPFLRTTDPEEQGEILEMASPRMSAMLDTGWSYLQGGTPGKAATAMYPNRQLRADLTAHPVMGKGANMSNHKIRTIEDAGADANDMGMGWKDQMTQMQGAMVEPTAIDSVQDLTREDAPTGQELRQIIRTAVAQMNIVAEVSVEPISGPTEIHLRQSD